MSNRKQLVYLSEVGGWIYEVWYGTELAFIGGAGTQERAVFLAAQV
jgi:hypothetical protein